MDDKKDITETPDRADWDSTAELSEDSATELRKDRSSNLVDVGDLDMNRLRKLLGEDRQILTLKRINQLLIIFVAALMLYLEYQAGHIPEFSELQAMLNGTYQAEILKANSIEENSQPTEKIVTYPYKDYLEKE